MKTTLTLAALAASCLAVATPAMAQQRVQTGYSQASDEDARFAAAQQRFDNEYALYQAAANRYRASRAQTRDPRYNDPRYNDPRYNDPRGGGYYDDSRDEGNYDPSAYYRNDPRYQERVLQPDERVYRGRDGKYYCKRSDGTTGLIVGAVAGGLLGNVIDGGHSRSAGTILGALVGGIAGSSIDRNSQVRCR